MSIMRSPRLKRAATRSAVTSLRLIGLLGLAALVLLPLLLHAAAPSWWATRGVIVAGATANDYSAVNQGQLKNIAKQAMQELDANLPGGASDAVHVMVDAWSFPTAATNDFSAVNLGQLKAVAKPFYDQLIAAGYTNQYPWAGAASAANDFAAANIGQAKNLFSFNVTSSVPGGIPDWWEEHYFGHLGVDPNALAPGGSGLTNLQEYQLGLNPLVASTMGDLYMDGWKVGHLLNPHHRMVADSSPAIVNLEVYTPLQ